MGYYTTVKVVNNEGKPVKAEISCGGNSKGFTDQYTGELSFDMYSQDYYDVYVKSSMHCNNSGKVRGGSSITIRLK